MPGYVIAEIEITDPTAFEEYAQAGPGHGAEVRRQVSRARRRRAHARGRLAMKASKGKLILVEGAS